jgi:multisubunit Na+/H+ antiporter MnhB subunit
MSVAAVVDIGLALLVAAVAAFTLAARETFSAVVGFVTYGLVLALVWVQLSAVDVALTEAAIGSGVTGVLLLSAVARLRPLEQAARFERPGAALRTIAAVLCACVTAGLAAVVLLLPEPAPTLAPEAAANLPATGLGNAVTAVLLSYRALDTLLETVVLVLALLGVWSLAPDRLWGGRPTLRGRVQRDGALAFLAQVLPPVGVVVALYVFWVGADAPGGKFQGATLLAAMWMLVLLAGVRKAPAVGSRGLRLVLVAGPLVFLAIGLAGLVLGSAFLAFPVAYAKPLILTIEAALVPSIAATLVLLVAGPPAEGPPR